MSRGKNNKPPQRPASASDTVNADTAKTDDYIVDDNKKVEDEQETEDQALIEGAIAELCEKLGAVDYDFAEVAEGEDQIVILKDLEGGEVARGTLTELQDQVFDNAEKKLKETEERVFALVKKFGADNFDIVSVEGNPELNVTLTKDGEEIQSGTLAELEAMEPPEADTDEDQSEDDGEESRDFAAEYAALRPDDIAPEDMQVRYRPFSRRKVSRVIKEFERDGVTYSPGEVFDWAALGLKPYEISKLYSRRLIRHIRQDDRIAYPFREPVKHADKVVSEPEKPTGTTAEEIKRQEDERKAKEAALAGRKFTRADQHLR